MFLHSGSHNDYQVHRSDGLCYLCYPHQPAPSAILFSYNVCCILDTYILSERDNVTVLFDLESQFSTSPGRTGSENYTLWRYTDSVPNYPYNLSWAAYLLQYIFFCNENKNIRLLCIIYGAIGCQVEKNRQLMKHFLVFSRKNIISLGKIILRPTFARQAVSDDIN